MNTIFDICCEIMHYLSKLLNMSYEECNILIFIYILPCIYLLLIIIIGISGFFKKSKLFGVILITSSIISGIYEFKMILYLINEYSLNSFNKAVETLNYHATLLNCTYQEVNILYFIVIPILYFILSILLIYCNSRH